MKSIEWIMRENAKHEEARNKEVETLRASNARLRQALAPFADSASMWAHPDETWIGQGCMFSPADLHRAAEVLKEEGA